MASKIGRVVTYHEGFPPIKSHDGLKRSFGKLKPLHHQYDSAYGPKVDGMVTIMKESTHKVTQNFGHVVLTLNIDTKLDRMVTYHERPPAVKAYYPLITWFYNITWETITTISPLQQGLGPPNVTKWWLRMRGYQPSSHMITWWLRGDSEVSHLKPHEPLIAWLIWGHMKISKIYISFFTILMATKIGRVLTPARSFIPQTLKLLATFYLYNAWHEVPWQQVLCWSHAPKAEIEEKWTNNFCQSVQEHWWEGEREKYMQLQRLLHYTQK